MTQQTSPFRDSPGETNSDAPGFLPLPLPQERETGNRQEPERAGFRDVVGAADTQARTLWETLGKSKTMEFALFVPFFLANAIMLNIRGINLPT